MESAYLNTIEVMTVISDYIKHECKEPKENSGTLLTSAYGWVAKSTLYHDTTSVSV